MTFDAEHVHGKATKIDFHSLKCYQFFSSMTQISVEYIRETNLNSIHRYDKNSHTTGV
jgi:hypothetical protein